MAIPIPLSVVVAGGVGGAAIKVANKLQKKEVERMDAYIKKNEITPMIFIGSYDTKNPHSYFNDYLKTTKNAKPKIANMIMKNAVEQVEKGVVYPIDEREQKQEGGSMDDQMMMIMSGEPMESDINMEDNYTKFIMEEALTEDEEDMLVSKLEQDEQLEMLFDKVIDVAQEFAGSGPVDGPGSGVSDSIPARLSDGEFVFTAKATEEIGADELMRMMKDAEAQADERQGMQEGGMTQNVEEEKVDQFGRPIDSDIARDELKKSMLSVNPRYQ